MKKINLKNKYKIVIVIAYTIVLLLNICFITYPKTNSFFKKDDDSALAYNTTLDALLTSSSDIIKSNKSSLKKIVLTYSFSRDNRYENDTYLFKATNNSRACTFTATSQLNEKGEYRFSSNSNGQIEFTCDVIENEDINVSLKLYEKVNTKIGTETVTETFLYKKKSYGEKWTEYAANFQIDTNTTIALDSTDIYNDFIKIMKAYIQKELKDTNSFISKYNSISENNLGSITWYQDYFDNYIKSRTPAEKLDNFKDNNNVKSILFNENLGNTFFGVTASELNTIGFKYTFDDDFVSYVLEDYFYASDNAKGSRIYLSSESNVKQVVENQINNWAFNNVSPLFEIKKDDINNLVIAYIEGYIQEYHGGIYSTTSLDDIPMVVFMTKAKPPFIILDNILDCAYNYSIRNKNKMKIINKEDPYDMVDVFRYGLVNIIKDETMSNNIIDEAYDEKSDLYKAITCTNCTENFTKEYSNNYYSYLLTVKHNINNTNPDKSYNEIGITKTPILAVNLATPTEMVESFNTKLDNVNVGAIFKTLKELLLNEVANDASPLYNAITSNADAVVNYYFNDKYYAVNVKHTTTNNIITINEVSLKKAIKSLTSSELPNALLAAANNSDSTLSKAAKETITSDEYNDKYNDKYTDIYYDGTNYYAVRINNKITENIAYNRIELLEKPEFYSFDLVIENIYNETLQYSLLASFDTNGYINSALATIATSPSASHYEIHSYVEKGVTNYILFEVTPYENDCNVLSSYLLYSTDAKNKTEMDKTIQMLKANNINTKYFVYFITDTPETTEQTLVDHMQSIFDFDYKSNIESINGYVISEFYIKKPKVEVTQTE